MAKLACKCAQSSSTTRNGNSFTECHNKSSGQKCSCITAGSHAFLRVTFAPSLSLCVLSSPSVCLDFAMCLQIPVPKPQPHFSDGIYCVSTIGAFSPKSQMLCIENNNTLNIFQILGMPRTKEPKFTQFMSWLHIFLVLLLHQLLFVCIPTAHSISFSGWENYQNTKTNVYACSRIKSTFTLSIYRPVFVAVQMVVALLLLISDVFSLFLGGSKRFESYNLSMRIVHV